jgi:hypothetical protein
MAKQPPDDDSEEAAADSALANARSILERVTGEKMPNRVTRTRAALGGTARAARLTPKRRSEIAAKAAAKRWKK